MRGRGWHGRRGLPPFCWRAWRLAWTTQGGTVHSRIVLFEPGRRLSWTGRLLVFRAIHVWPLVPAGDGETTVTTTGSIGGWPIGWLYSAAELHVADQRWLAALKRKAEQVAGTPSARSG